MPDRPDKQKRKEMLDQWRAKERASARSKLPLSDEQMKAIFDMLADALSREGCDQSLRLVLRWLQEQGIEGEPVEAWLHENGGHCDCEALANSRPAWRDAIYDVDW